MYISQVDIPIEECSDLACWDIEIPNFAESEIRSGSQNKGVPSSAHEKRQFVKPINLVSQITNQKFRVQLESRSDYIWSLFDQRFILKSNVLSKNEDASQFIFFELIFFHSRRHAFSEAYGRGWFIGGNGG